MKKIFILLLCTILFFSCSSPESTTSKTAAKWHGKERGQRYEPDGQDFKIVNGNMKFNRALYGTNTAFRIEAGDIPEFAFYMPGMGGNTQLALTDGKKTVWLNNANKIVTRYRPGAMIYEINDPILGNGKLTLIAIAMADEEGLILKADFENSPESLKLITIYGGASDKRFSRSGDLNADPPDSFFLKAENCKDNHYTLTSSEFLMVYGNKLNLSKEELRYISTELQKGNNTPDIQNKKYKLFIGSFPENSEISLISAHNFINNKEIRNIGENDSLPIIKAVMPVNSTASTYICLHNPQKRVKISENELPKLYQEAENKRAELAGRLVINTPDPYINTLGGVISVTGDAIYEYPSYLHGAISWRMRLNGWRGAYVADVLGWNDRAQNHFHSYSLSQLTSPASAPVEMDTALNLTRSREKLGNAMFSSGYICRNPGGDFRPHHYDMNLVFIDQMLNHFAWTGDIEFLKKMWPTLTRHLAWEKRVFDPDSDGLYDAYACIWASDALMYNNGGVTHSSAYNYKANKLAAELAVKIGKDPRPYQKEAEKILNAINKELWLSDKGWWAEFIDRMGNGFQHPAAGLWTIYHAIDSDIHDDFQAYQALRYIDTEIPHIPFEAVGFENEGYYLLSTTNWLPYSWSVNNVAFAELMHTALAYWQGGRRDEAFKLWKSTILDAMYCGLSPGNIGQISFYDAARGETYRDFADPTGMAARSVVEGLFGIKPDLMNNRLKLTPGFPESWPHASIHLPYLDFSYKSENNLSSYSIVPRMNKEVEITLKIPALMDDITSVKVNGKNNSYTLNSNIGYPTLSITMPPAKENNIEIAWAGNKIINQTPEIIAAINELNVIDFGNDVIGIKDPQTIITDQEISDSHVQVRLEGDPGERTFFANVRQGKMDWWQPVHVHLGKAVEIIPAQNENAQSLNFYVKNNSERELKGKLVINPNGKGWEKELIIQPKESSQMISVPATHAIKGTNIVQVHFSGKIYEAPVVDWEIAYPLNNSYSYIDMKNSFNDKVTQIFKNRYLSPRSQYTSLQLPAQGVGEWCHPKLTWDIDDSGLRSKATDNIFTTPFNLSFSTPQDRNEKNIAFVSLWDNYPDQINIPLEGKASHAYFLMAGSTNHMQSQFDNGTVKIYYKDGSESVLVLRNPETWAPIEQDYFVDGYAFAMKQARPFRVVLKTGHVARDFEDILKGKKLDARNLEGGGAIILDLPLDKTKELDRLEVKALANDVVIGMMGITLIQ